MLRSCVPHCRCFRLMMQHRCQNPYKIWYHEWFNFSKATIMMEEGRRHPILLPCTQKHTCRGPCIKDVRTEGGGGLRNLPILRTNSTDRLREMRTRGREGVQISQNFADVLFDARRLESRVLVIGFCLTTPNSPRAFSWNLYAIDN